MGVAWKKSATGADVVAAVIAAANSHGRAVITIAGGEARITIPGAKGFADDATYAVGVSEKIDPAAADAIVAAAEARTNLVRRIREEYEKTKDWRTVAAALKAPHWGPLARLAGLASESAPEEKEKRAAKREAKKPESRTSAIKALRAAGMEPRIIAAMLNVPVGEVEAHLAATQSTL